MEGLSIACWYPAAELRLRRFRGHAYSPDLSDTRLLGSVGMGWQQKGSNADIRDTRGEDSRWSHRVWSYSVATPSFERDCRTLIER